MYVNKIIIVLYKFGVADKIMDKIKNKKVDVKELKRLKKEKKKLKEAEIIAKLEKTKTLQANLAAKPVPKAGVLWFMNFSLNLPPLEYRVKSQ